MGKTKVRQEGTKDRQEGKRKGTGKSVPYHGQRPHRQGTRPGPLVCFTSNLKNALRKAFPGFKHKTDEPSKKCKSRIECLMDYLAFDINQLLVYENQKKRCKKPAIISQLQIMKLKAEEIKSTSLANKCILRAEEMLKRKSHLKCTSRALRKGLIEFMANAEQTDRRSKIVCEIMTQLDTMDMDIAGLCKSVKEMPKALTCDIQTAADCAPPRPKRGDCGDVKTSRPAICEEVMRPYDPATDEDSSSIHLRYVPALDSFKAHMARNPCALRLPLMCPPMKRIMNKMKVCYLMDDVPVKLEPDDPKSKIDCCPIVSYANVQHRGHEDKEEAAWAHVGRRTPLISPPTSCKNQKMQVNDEKIYVYSFKDIHKLWYPTIKQIKEMCS